jgi:hypothetical protein
MELQLLRSLHLRDKRKVTDAKGEPIAGVSVINQELKVADDWLFNIQAEK